MKIKIIVREILAFSIWAYIFLKIIIFDFDIYLFQKYLPNFSWIIEYKFFVFLCLLSILVIVSRGRNLLMNIGFILIYPLFLFAWRIPKLLFKTENWIGIFISIELITSFFKSLKLNVILLTVFLIACLFIIVSSSKYSLFVSMISLFLFLFFHYYRRIIYAFRPASVFSMQSKAVSNIWETSQKQIKLNDDIKKLRWDDLTEQQRIERNNNLQYALILNKACYFLISKLRKLQKSRLAVLYALSNIFYTFFLTILIFSFLNLALYKVYPNSFSGQPKSDFLFFFYYSFNTIISNNINDFYPIDITSQMFNTIEMTFGIVLLLILFFLMTTIFREKHDEEIEASITVIDDQAGEIEEFINSEFNLTIEQATEEVERIKGVLLKVLNYLVSNIDA